jgi:hypothetical protein
MEPAITKVIIRGDNDGVILWDSGEGAKPLIGAFKVGNLEIGYRWIPCSWTRNGWYDIEEKLEYNQDIVKWGDDVSR